MEQHGISKLDLKRRNRMQVLRILKQNGPTSRIDIANQLELTRAAVTIITTDMIEQGIIYEVGEYKNVGDKALRGRKKILIDINYHYKFVVGVTVEEDIVSVGLSTLSGDVLDKLNMSIDSNTEMGKLIEFIEKSIHQVLNNNCLSVDQVLGIGFGIYPHMYSRLNINVDEEGNPDYSELEKYIKTKTNLPVVIENSIQGTAMANIDFRKNISSSVKNMVYIQYGNNINFLFTYLNEPIGAYHNHTDCIDKVIIDPYSKDVCSCGRRGCVENELSFKAVRHRIKNLYSKATTPYLYNLTSGNCDNITYEMIVESYKNGDEGVIKTLDRAIDLMAVLINNLNFFANPNRIVLHLFQYHHDFVYDLLKKSLEKISGKQVADKLITSNVSKSHRFLSGCAIAIRELFFARGGFDI